MLRIGIDVGGTHTDAVLVRGTELLAATKTLTTADVISGVMDALERVLADHPGSEAQVTAVMLGTTQFTNAVVERRHLVPVGAIRLAAPSGKGLDPKIGWPDDVAAALGDHAWVLRGGYLYDGRPLADIDDAEVDRLIAELAASDLQCVAITSAFSPMNAEPEVTVADRISAALPDMRIVRSHDLGRLGILERENAALLNASLLPFAERVVGSFTEAVRGRGLNCRFFVSQNDGTLMNASFAQSFPALTFASGPTNSLRGAGLLSGLENAIVVDIGGTTSDIGVLRDGFPRESTAITEIGGVRTNFRMPDLLTLGLGGGSLVSDDGSTVGPQSLGHRLVEDGLAFGGSTLTATDIVVAAGTADIGDRRLVERLSPELIDRARATITEMLDTAIDRMRPDEDPMPVVLVGGGAVLVDRDLRSASRVVRPEHAGVANAIGAAQAQIGGEAEQLVSYRNVERSKAIEMVTASAAASAIAAGADATSIRTADVEEIAMSYMEGAVNRVRVKVVGDIVQDGPGDQ